MPLRRDTLPRRIAPFLAIAALVLATSPLLPGRAAATAVDFPETLPLNEIRVLKDIHWRNRTNPVSRLHSVEPHGSFVESPQRLPARSLAIELGSDVLVNNKTLATCSQCQNLPLVQTEASVAVQGPNVLVSFNEGKSSCAALNMSRQNYSFSIDGGQTFVEGNGFPPMEVVGGRLSGDPSVAVNRNTGAFYVGGLLLPHTGAIKGHFSGGTFVFDRLRRVATSPGGLFDKPWMTVDSLTGNVYFTWTWFVPEGTTEIQFLRCDADLNPLGPVVTLNDPSEGCGSQYSGMAVGPDGELYVMWLQAGQCQTYIAGVMEQIIVRRSDDGGATFGPRIAATLHPVNVFNGGAGFHRVFAATQPSIAVDCTDGPHRGRIHLAWDQALDYVDDPLLETTTLVEVEPNNTDATANVLIPGGKLRGANQGPDNDWFSIDMQAGQTFFMSTVYNFDSPGGYDSTRTGARAQLFCREPGGTLRRVVNASGGSGGILWTAPKAGTYYMRLEMLSPEAGTEYVFHTLFIPYLGESARDHRDQMTAFSDDGVTWSTPQRINDSAPGRDGQYPTLAVDGKGVVHCVWMDFREDGDCGLPSRQYVASSGDGGVTWGPNRLLGDVAAAWPAIGQVCSQLNGNTHGDYQDVDAEGDVVIAAFNDARLGDPDIMVDVTRHQTTFGCPLDATASFSTDTTVTLALTNTSNYARTLSWRVEDSRGWLLSGVPALSGTQALAAGQTLTVQATLNPGDDAGLTSTLQIIASDPAIPGYEEHCGVDVSCPALVTATFASLVSASAESDRVRLAWHVVDPAYVPRDVERRTTGSEWATLGPALAGGRDEWTYVDREVTAETRYAYRLTLAGPEGVVRTAETWVLVSATARFEVVGFVPNPSTGDPDVVFALEGREPAHLDLFDITGRLVLSREVSHFGPGRHRLRLESSLGLAAGVYTVRVRQGTRQASVNAVLMR